ncbi:MAG TPA: hypothetical protein VMW34_01720 [Anaerolineales bacterium]|nr:hypothetical protein [Anaerolineales bacterium]
MDSIFLGINTLISSWIAAILLAALVVFFLIRTEYFRSLINWLERASPNEFILHNSRSLLTGSILISIGLFLAILMSLEPDQDGILLSTGRNIISDAMWERYYPYMDDLFIALGILFLLAFIPSINFIFSRICKIINNHSETRFRVVRFQNLEIFTPNQMVAVLVVIAKYVRLGVILVVFILFITLVFSLYPQTDGLAQTLLLKINEGLSAVWKQVL